ncbi:MAG: hypothetical protein HQK83_00270 [Fibrobacteria bacterium]|nr:hypothetical protein [Fibrobacteria bacterium]
MFKILLLPITLLLVIITTHIYALDTTEPFDIGFTDFEMIGAMGGLGLAKGEKELGWEGVVGVGLTENFSATLNYGFSSDEYFNGEGTEEFSFGIYYSAKKSGIFKLDLIGSACTGGGIDFGTEINLDFKTFGAQLTVVEGFGNIDTHKVAYSTSLEPLFYFPIAQSMELMTAIDFAFNHKPVDGERSFGIGGIKAGFNFAINDALEFLPEISFDIPQKGESFSTGFAFQFISTLPAGN